MISGEHPFILWSFLIAVFVVITILHTIENKKLKKHLKDKHDEVSVKHIVHFSWTRTIQFLFVIFLFFTVVVVYDVQVRKLQNKIIDMQDAQSISTLLAPSKTMISIPEKKPDEPAPVVLKPIEVPTGDSIEDIFDSKNSPAIMDNIKARYEELIVNYLLMQKCGKAGKDDYQIIIGMLQKDITTAQMPQRLQDDIMTAAQGSYAELYSKVECSDPAIENSSKQYNAYITSLSARLGKN